MKKFVLILTLCLLSFIIVACDTEDDHDDDDDSVTKKKYLLKFSINKRQMIQFLKRQ